MTLKKIMGWVGCIIVGEVLVAGIAQAQYTFGAEMNRSPASITYTSATGVFQYSAPGSGGVAALPLAGTAAGWITTASNWTASLQVDLAARTLPGTSGAPYVFMGLIVTSGGAGNDKFLVVLGQFNNSSGADGSDVTDGFYGCAVKCETFTVSSDAMTTLLNRSRYPDDSTDPFQSVDGTFGTPDLAEAESVNGVIGTVSLVYSAATGVLTGYFNGEGVGSYSLAAWGANAPLSLAVFGNIEDATVVASGTATGSNFQVNQPVKLMTSLSAVQAKAGLAVQWSESGFTLETASSPTGPWSVVVGATSPYTNVISGAKEQFFRLVGK